MKFQKRKVLRAGIMLSMATILTLPTLHTASASAMPLQPTSLDQVEGQYYVPSTVENIRWGHLPNRDSKPVLTVPSGSTVTFDTVSHEGIVEDQGRNPVEYFGSHGVPADQVLEDAKTIAASSIEHDFDNDGPHIVTGPVAVEGAEPGDVLKVEVLSLQTRVPYGVISNRHYKGALPGEFPENDGRQEGASAEQPELYNNVSIFTPIEEIHGRWYGVLPTENNHKVRFPINPFLGVMGVAPDSSEKISSIPPTETGGNIDINELGVGSTLYLPVKVSGALFYTGDPHFAQGDGEVALTALEASLRGTLRLTVLKEGDPSIPRNGEFKQPFAETEDYWIPIGLDPDLDEAMKEAVRESIAFLSEKLGMSREVAYAYLSAATDYEVSQVVDRTKGIHGLIRKTDFLESLNIHVNVNGNDISPSVVNNKFYVPLRDIVEGLGGTVKWDSATRSAIVTLQEKSITVKNDSSIYTIDGKEIYNEGMPQIMNEKTMVPVKTVREILGAYVNWTTTGTELNAAIAIHNK